MDRVLEILNDIDDSIDYTKETKLIDNHLLDSFAIISLVSELEDAFDIEVDAAEMTPENFNSAEAIWKMVQRLQEN
ncbi:MAG: acyl carrier protein [Erysipelotrichaceae bacterium]|jgi:acyl carrier protein|uniref:Acyl carrier protein n=1 Tax=Grylomicrobium aquisgranensis TaxID=2926318 RepID=A0AB35U2W6_9FIRM|nr:acyl carrier protein [Lactimicrobium massiliense]MCH4019515.1 acyl carrier protein [Erysipelotrichaceae bacterium]MCI1327264.1 acyl carrier protein [Solobacterium sp.]MDX8419466.1 acyl carrier protein [Stecheria sp. CLA-KB-P133]MCH4045489.1 acyl carrier protein [Erysipelotrichaceae bacterium]MCH4122699.1 acyl carrier protein [Erysipelotrichaceae bacterium]